MATTTQTTLHLLDLAATWTFLPVYAAHMACDLVLDLTVKGTRRHAVLHAISAETLPWLVPLTALSMLTNLAVAAAGGDHTRFIRMFLVNAAFLAIMLAHRRGWASRRFPFVIRPCPGADDRWRNRRRRLTRWAGSLGHRPATVPVSR